MAKVNLDALKATSLASNRGERSERGVRFTVDLPETGHHALKVFALNNRASMSDVFRVVVKMIREQEAIATAVSKRVRDL